MSEIVRVYAFDGAWGLPTTGPFALKLLAWLQLAGIEHTLVHENDTRKGPKGKSPWIEHRGQRMGDSQLIVEYLQRELDVDPDAWLTDQQRAVSLAFRHLFEEHWHQIYEYEFIVHDDGFPHFRRLFDGLPPIVRSVLAWLMRRGFRKQLHARGVIRHAPDVITRVGIDDVQAFATVVGDGPFAFGERPCSLDAVAFGFLAPAIYSPVPTPVWSHVRDHAVLRPYVERLRERWFEGTAAESSPSALAASPASPRTDKVLATGRVQ